MLCFSPKSRRSPLLGHSLRGFVQSPKPPVGHINPSSRTGAQPGSVSTPVLSAALQSFQSCPREPGPTPVTLAQGRGGRTGRPSTPRLSVPLG